eukprot:15443337-Alexandrium_andersonii.AAC.1
MPSAALCYFETARNCTVQVPTLSSSSGRSPKLPEGVRKHLKAPENAPKIARTASEIAPCSFGQFRSC